MSTLAGSLLLTRWRLSRIDPMNGQIEDTRGDEVNLIAYLGGPKLTVRRRTGRYSWRTRSWLQGAWT